MVTTKGAIYLLLRGLVAGGRLAAPRGEGTRSEHQGSAAGRSSGTKQRGSSQKDTHDGGTWMSTHRFGV